MNLLYCHPRQYLVAHWLLTLTLAVALLAPQLESSPKQHTVTLLTGQVVALDAAGVPEPKAGLAELASPAYGTLAVPFAAEQELGVFFDPHLFAVSYLERQGFGDILVATFQSFAQDKLAFAGRHHQMRQRHLMIVDSPRPGIRVVSPPWNASLMAVPRETRPAVPS